MQAGFMILNNTIWVIVFMLFFAQFKTIGGMNFETWIPFYVFTVMLFGIVHVFFNGYWELAQRIIEGRLDNDILTPKSPLLKILTKSMSFSAIGDLCTGPIFLAIFTPHLLLDGGFIARFILMALIATLAWLGAMIFYNSLSFWIGSSERVTEGASNAILWSAFYPSNVFEGTPMKWILLTIFPAYFVIYYPQAFSVSSWDFGLLSLSLAGAVGFLGLGVFTFYRGLRRYESGNMMVTNV
jgi:ABC-2 type transport system permease protein